MKNYFTEIRRQLRKINYDIYISSANEQGSGRIIRVVVHSLLNENLFTERLYRDLDLALRDIEDWVEQKRKKLNEHYLLSQTRQPLVC